MGILKGALTVRRYHVEGEIPDDFRSIYVDALNDHAFRERPAASVGEEVGVRESHNLLDTDFSDLNRWLYNHYAMFSLRVDKKVLPAALQGPSREADPGVVRGQRQDQSAAQRQG